MLKNDKVKLNVFDLDGIILNNITNYQSSLPYWLINAETEEDHLCFYSREIEYISDVIQLIYRRDAVIYDD